MKTRPPILARRSFLPTLCATALATLLACSVQSNARMQPQTLSSYDPMRLPSNPPSEILELTVQDPRRDRAIPLRLYLPAHAQPAAVILFSHGLGGHRGGSAFLGQHWAGRGYVAVFLQHPGSDDTVWKGVPRNQRLKAMKQAASLENFMLRVQDIPAVLNQLEIWSQARNHTLSGRLNLTQVGMAGHSFGAVTTQAISGQSFPGQGTHFTDSRIRAALVLSPSSPRRGNPSTDFSSVKIPWLLMTGTQDLVPLLGNVNLESRLAVFPNLPPGDKYELVLDQAEHSVFTDRQLPGDRPRNPNHHPAILALSTAFWDAYLRNDAMARSWLKSNAVRSVLESQDRWQFK